MDVLQHEQAIAGMAFEVLGLFGEMFFLVGAGGLGMFAFFIRKCVEEFTNRNVRSAASGLGVKAARLHFHNFSLATRDLYAERTHHPDRAALQKAPDVFAANGRDLLAKAVAE